MQTVNLPQYAWFDPRDLEITLPDEWTVEICRMQGENRPALTEQAILAALQKPINSAPLREIAKTKKEAVIVFDDLTRVTRTAKIAPGVINELKAGGLTAEHIRFICGTGLHGVMNRSHFAKKLGEEIVSNYAVYSHNPFGNVTFTGTTATFQTPVYINEEYLKCDLKIVIGGCVPHTAAGFGGGSKLILPGISGYETINHHHTVGGTRMDPATGQKPTQGMGIIENNRFKQNIDEAAEIAGIDFLINVTTNLAGDSVAIYCGEWKSAYAAALQDAQANYKTQKAIGFQVVVSNGYAKVSESMLSLSAAIPLVDTRGGDIVVIANAPEGQVTHYIAGIFGKTTYACHYTPCPIPDYVRHVFVLNEYPHPGGTCFKDDPRIIYFRRWEDVLARLQNEHPAPVRLAVIPDATMQYFNWYD